MGNTREYIASGGFAQYLYCQIGDTLVSGNGVSGKIITEYDDGTNFHSSLPMFPDTSEVYFKMADDKNIVEQARVYINRQVSLDFDWNHTHRDFQRGIVHVHEWGMNKDGKWTRTGNVRYMNNNEIERYGELLRLANPKVKFRP